MTYVWFGRAKKSLRLAEAIRYLPEPTTADEVASWPPGVWDNLVHYVNAMADEREPRMGRPSAETKALVVRRLRAAELRAGEGRGA